MISIERELYLIEPDLDNPACDICSACKADFTARRDEETIHACKTCIIDALLDGLEPPVEKR